MKTRPRHTMTATVCMLAAVLGLGAADQLGVAVACVGFDGHVDVESLPCSCCIASASHDEEVHPGLAPASPFCSDCVDVQLSVTPLSSNKKQLSYPDIIALGCTFGPSCDSGCRKSLAVSAKPMDQRSQSLASLSTVVLLT